MSNPADVSFREAVIVWFRIGILSFGGPAAQISLLHNIVVEEKRWISEKNYLSALGFCMMLPGPEAMQLATYVGWRLHGVLGGLAAGILFVVPGALVVLGLAVAYALFGESSILISIFYGIKAAVIAIIFDALIKIARRSLKSRGQWILACLGFIALFFFALPFPIVVLAAAVWGFCRGKSFVGEFHSNNTSQISFGRLGMTVLVWSGLWFAPIFFLWILFPNQLLTEVATFFSTLAITSFGGAYAVLAYVAQEAVSSYNWLTAAQMMDGLGLAETTPGPLILVTEFVGFMAGFTAGGITLGIASAAITLWVTFVPCFLWIFAGAPFIEVIATRPSLASALASITAVIVGVILNLSVWFALHVFFGDIEQNNYGPIIIWEPTFSSFDSRAAVLVLIAVLMIFAFKQSVLRVLLSVTLVSVALTAFNL